MLEAGQVFVSPRGTRVEVLENSHQRISIRRSLPPMTGGTQAKSHRHTAGIEIFELLTGTATAWLDGNERRLAGGDLLEIPVGSAHVNPYTAAGETATLIQSVSPRPRAVEVYFTSWLYWLGRGMSDASDEPSLWQVAAIIREGGFGGTWASSVPVPLQRVALPLLGQIAWLSGTRAARP